MQKLAFPINSLTTTVVPQEASAGDAEVPAPEEAPELPPEEAPKLPPEEAPEEEPAEKAVAIIAAEPNSLKEQLERHAPSVPLHETVETLPPHSKMNSLIGCENEYWKSTSTFSPWNGKDGVATKPHSAPPP